MIDAEQIAAFQEDNSAKIEAATEFSRRAQKGLPVDRWGSTAQLRDVAEGIHVLLVLLAMHAEINKALVAEIARKGADAMRLHKAHQG